MITSVYIYSYIDSSFHLYPNNGDIFFKNLCKNAVNGSQLIIHREGGLMYYNYITKTANGNIYGICIVNSDICLDIRKLFTRFVNILVYAAKKGEVFKFDTNGEIVLNLFDFVSKKGEIENLFSHVKGNLNKNFHKLFKPISNEDYSINKNAIVHFSLEEDDIDKITDAIEHYNNIYVTQKNANPSSFALQIKSLNDQYLQWKKKYEDLQDSYSELSRKKTKFTWIVVISLILFLVSAAFVWAAIYYEDNLDYAKGDIKEKKERISQLSDQNSEIESKLAAEKERNEELLSFISKIKSTSPIIITSDPEFDFNSGVLEFNYIGLKDTTINVLVTAKKYNDRNSDERNVTKSDIHLKRGNTGSCTVHLGYGFNTNKYYCFEIRLKNAEKTFIPGGKTWY